MLKALPAVDELNVGSASIPARDLLQAVTLLRELALEHAEPPKQAGSVIGSGEVKLFPDALYRNTKPINIEGAQARQIIENIDSQPTRTDPEKWFQFWAQQCALLGKMPTLGDLQGVIKSNLQSFAKRFFHPDSPPRPIVTRDEAPESVHDFHVAFFGTRTDSWSGQEGLHAATLGYSGEDSLFAGLIPTREPYVFPTIKKSIVGMFEKKYGHAERSMCHTKPDECWDRSSRKWFENYSRERIIGILVDQHNLGGLTDPRVLALARPAMNTLFSSAPGSSERIAAVKELKEVLKNGPGRGGPDAGSVQAIRTEMVLVQALSAYFEESGLGKQYQAGKVDANTVFDMGRVHQIYQEMEKRGALVSPDDVRAMLGRLGVSAK